MGEYINHTGEIIYLTDDEQYSTILATVEGPVCGLCRKYKITDEAGNKIRHFNSANVQACYDRDAQMEADSRSEIEAQNAVERHYEDRGYWDTQAEGEWDRMRGVVDDDYFVAL